jgi:Rap1a immunity proteins
MTSRTTLLMAGTAVAFAACTSAVHATVEGKLVLDACTQPVNDPRSETCSLFVRTVADMLQVLRATKRENETCIPGTVTGQELADVFVAHIRKAMVDFPEQRAMFEKGPAVMLAMGAFKAKWPCK